MKNIRFAILLICMAVVVFATMIIVKSYNPSKYIIQNQNQEIAEQSEIKSMLGEAYMQMLANNLNGAEKTLHLLLRKAPYNQNALLLLGNIFCEQKKYSDAEEIFQKLIKIAPQNAVYLNNLAQSLAMQGKYIDSLHYFKKAIELDPDAPHPHLNLAEVYIKLNRKKAAVSELKKAFEMKTDSSISINLEAFDALKDEVEFQELIHTNTKAGEKK